MSEHPRDSQPSSEPAADPPALGRRRRVPGWLARPIRWAWGGIRVLAGALLIAWGSLALYYSNLPWSGVRLLLAVAFAVFGIWALRFARNRRGGRWAFAGVLAAVFAWFAAIPPSHDRPWRPEVAIMPRAVALDGAGGNVVRFTGYRDVDYRTRDDFTVRWVERTVDISRITSVDLLISYWKPGPVAHTFVSFNLDDGSPPVCVSIEARPEVGERFKGIASMFKQFELIYVVGEERDLVRVRTNHRDEEVYLYRIRASPEGAQRLFRIYCERINELADRPEFYHLLKNSCTVNIVRCANRAGRSGGWNIRHLLNGLIDQSMYAAGAVDAALPFDELRRRSRITDAARRADESDPARYSQQIRAGLPAAPTR